MNLQKVNALIDELGLTIDMLTELGEKVWVPKLVQAKDLLEASYIKDGADKVLGLFGGMGSLSDITIHPLNGYKVSDEEGAKLTNELSKHLSKIHTIARELSRGLPQEVDD